MTQEQGIAQPAPALAKTSLARPIVVAAGATRAYLCMAGTYRAPGGWLARRIGRALPEDRSCPSEDAPENDSLEEEYDPSMTVSELYQAIADGGTRTAAFVIVTPLLIGGLALVLRDNGKPKASQILANIGIVLGLLAVAVEVMALIYGVQELGINPLSDVDILLLMAPLYLLGAGILIEHLVHPGTQEGLRKKIRAGVLSIIILAVLFFLLGKLRLYMLVWTSMTGFILFIGFLVAVFYFMVRKVV